MIPWIISCVISEINAYMFHWDMYQFLVVETLFSIHFNTLK